VDTVAIAPKACDSYSPQRPRIAIGLQQLAFTTLTGALEDMMGRGVGCYRNDKMSQRRMNASRAIRWLRSAGRGDLSPFTPDWVAHVLDMDARKMVRHGVARLGFKGLHDWREFRTQRNLNRIQRLPRLSKQCAHCHCTFETKDDHRRFCSSACSNASRRPQPEQREGTAGSVGMDRYALYCLFCERLDLKPATEMFWRMVAG